MTPPRPVGKGHLAVTGRNEARPAASTPPMIHKISRVLTLSSRRVVISRKPQRPGGTMSPMTPRPSICMSKSAAMAPRDPRRFRTAPEVAWLKLGSSTDQDNRASVSAIVPAMRQIPANSAPRRAAKARTKLGDQGERRHAGCRPHPFPAAMSHAPPPCSRRAAGMRREGRIGGEQTAN